MPRSLHPCHCPNCGMDVTVEFDQEAADFMLEGRNCPSCRLPFTKIFSEDFIIERAQRRPGIVP